MAGELSGFLSNYSQHNFDLFVNAINREVTNISEGIKEDGD
jgi:hypothetical protein